MTIEEMTYYFNEQLKNADNESYQQYLQPQIDFILNVAQETFIKMIAFPLYNPYPTFEATNRVKNAITPLVMNTQSFDVIKQSTDTFYLPFPTDCYLFMGGTAIADNGTCQKKMELFPVNHDVNTTHDYITKSSFIWEECNFRFVEKGIQIEADNFNVSKVIPTYIRKSKYMYDAVSFKSPYKHIKTGEVLTGKQDSELLDIAHLDIVNLAVLLTKSFNNSNLESQLLKIRDLN